MNKDIISLVFLKGFNLLNLTLHINWGNETHNSKFPIIGIKHIPNAYSSKSSLLLTNTKMKIILTILNTVFLAIIFPNSSNPWKNQDMSVATARIFRIKIIYNVNVLF